MVVVVVVVGGGGWVGGGTKARATLSPPTPPPPPPPPPPTAAEPRFVCAGCRGVISAGVGVGLGAWFIDSSMTVREALLQAIWKPFITAMIESPFQSFCITCACLDE